MAASDRRPQLAQSSKALPDPSGDDGRMPSLLRRLEQVLERVLLGEPTPAQARFLRISRSVNAVTLVPYLLAEPTEVVVALVRRARGRTGVPMGPTLVASVNAVAGVVAARALASRPDVWRRRAVLLPALGWAALSPALAAAAGERAVVLRGRSPLWALLVQAVPRALVRVPVLLPSLLQTFRGSPSVTDGARQVDVPRGHEA